MLNPRVLKQRIKSIKSTLQITKAMELVASSRMRKAMQAVLASRNYAQSAWEIIKSLTQENLESHHPLLQSRSPIKNIVFLLLTTNKGLCGSLNYQVVALTKPFLKSDKNVSFVTWGKKGREIIRRFSSNILADFERTEKIDDLTTSRAIADFLIALYLEGKADEVILTYPDFVSTLKQEPLLLKLLPLGQAPSLSLGSFKEAAQNNEAVPKVKPIYLMEPGAEAVLGALLPRIIRVELYQAFLESFACEQAARMVAMKNASDNAEDLTSDLTLFYNQLRQSAITKELAEISGTRAALGF